jgi:hypothetical protein
LSAARHTPGPWRWADNKRGERRLVAADGTPVLGVRDESTHTRSEVHVEPWSDEDERLIAAAPKLLAACERAEMLIRAGGLVPIKGETWAALREAIAEARGNA